MGKDLNPRWAIFLAGFLVGFAFNQFAIAAQVKLEKIDWPKPKSCLHCITLQFMKLEMKLPIDKIGKILVIGGGDSGLHIIPRPIQPKKSVLFLAIPPEKLLGVFQANGLLRGLHIKTNEQLFDTIGKVPNGNKPLEILRKIKGSDVAERYTKASKNSVHAYRIKSPLTDGFQNIYFVFDREDVVYVLSGDVTQDFYEEVLANIRVSDVP